MGITIEQRQYTTYILTAEDGSSRIELIPERGGIVTSWQVGDKELLYLDSERLTDPKLSVRGGIPILFPICGNLIDHSYTYQGTIYPLKQHGFARDLPWQFAETPEQTNSITLILESDAITLAGFPFAFQLAFTYTLEGTALVIHQQFINLSDHVMPFAAGFHPYFLVPDKTQLSFEIPGTTYWDNVTKTTQAYDGTFDLSQAEIDASFNQLSAASMHMIDQARQLTLSVEYDQPFTTFVFWTVQGKEFICLEPWMAPRNAMNTSINLQHIEPQTSFETEVRFVIKA